MLPLATIVIDTFNHERFIEKAILSVLQQDFSQGELEILVVDDGSADRTPEIVRKFVPRVRYLRKLNGGQASAFNAAFPETQGEIIVTLDGDDWWAPQKLRRQMDTMEAHPDVGIVGHGYFEADAEDRTCATILPGISGHFDLTTPKGALRFGLLRGFFGAPRMAVRRWVLERIMPIPEELIIEADEYIFTLAPALASAYILNEPLVYYRLHGGNLFQAHQMDDRGKRRKSKVLNDLVTHLPPRLADFGMSDVISNALLQPLPHGRNTFALEPGWRQPMGNVSG